jgi:hypothetical protein
MDQVIVKNRNDKIQGIFQNLFTVKKFAKKNRESGTWPDSESAIWALRAGSPQNGFGDVFVTVGRRVLISEQKFMETLARLQKSKNA